MSRERSTPKGQIAGNDNDADATRFEPHYNEIKAADQVQIYESIMVDQAGAVTTGLLTAVRYVKDNRLLPRGFDKRTADAGYRGPRRRGGRRGLHRRRGIMCGIR